MMRWIMAVSGYILLLPLSYPAAVIVSLFSRNGWPAWARMFATYDNPPQGDNGWITKRSPFPNIVTGWRGYVNRVGWLWRNKLYGYKRAVSIEHDGKLFISIKGNPDISDKYRRAGRMHASARDSKGRLKAFEWYSVTPYGFGRCVRIRLGWKIKGRKFVKKGDFAPLVFTFNPVDGYGND